MTTYVSPISGGLDSTGVLIYLLRETNDRVRAHHIRLMTRDNRFEAEYAAIQKIIPYLQANHRQFFYSESLHDFRQVGLNPMLDAPLVYFTIGQICRSTPNIDYYTIGRVRDDIDASENPGHAERVQMGLNVYAACFGNDMPPIPRALPIEHMSKAELCEYIAERDPEILDWVHYCRGPVLHDGAWYNCEQCKSCRVMAKNVPHVYERKCL